MKERAASKGYSLRAHLILFGLAIVLPVLVFAALLFGQIQGQERTRTETAAAALANNVAIDVERELARDRVFLRTLSTNPFLREGDIEAFRSRAGELGPLIGGEVTMTLAPGVATDRRTTLTAGEAAGLAVVFAPAGATSASFALTLPLINDGGAAGSLTLTVPASRMTAILEEEAIPPGWSTEVVDAEGRRIAATGPASAVPAAPPSTAQPVATGKDAPFWDTRDAGGRRALVVRHPIGQTGWSVRATVPEKALRASMQRSVAVLAWAGGALVLLSFLIALFFGRRLAAPIRRVTGAAMSLPEGRVPDLPLSPVREANDLGRALTEAAGILRARAAELTRAHDELANIYDGSPIGIGLFARSGQAQRVNRAFAALGLPDGPEGGIDLSGWDDFRALVDDVAVAGAPVAGRDLVFDQPERRRVFRASAFPAGCPSDDQRAIGVTLEDVTERREAEDAIAEGNARIQRLLDANFFGLAIVRDGVVIEANDAFLATLDRPRAGLGEGLSLQSITPSDFHALDERALADVETSGTCKAFEKDLIRSDGRRVPCLVGYARLGRNPLSVICFALDLTEQRQRDTQRRYLMRELTHRTKNLLAVVQAMAVQTAKASGNPAEFHDRFAARLQGLAGSHDLLVQENWSGASMRDLVRSQLGHYAEGIGTQIHLDGPRILLGPDAAQNLGMALHELSTNAAKYGSLSVPEGRVDIAWRIDPPAAGEEARLVVDWRESGGPPVVPPRRKGFGHVVMDRLAARALDGHVQMAFAPEGVSWRLTAPASSATWLDEGAGEAGPSLPAPG